MTRIARRPQRVARERDAETLAKTLRYDEAREAHREGRIDDAELTSVYIAARVYEQAGSRWLQAERRPKLVTTSSSPSVHLFAERELYRIPRPVHAAICAWAAGERPVDLLFHVPSPRDLLALQARGRRCVSLLDEGVSTAPHADGLAFIVHDLCHLEKFVDPQYHLEQIGFFKLVERMFDDPRWKILEGGLDAEWVSARDHVIADMNGSSAFLFVVLRSALKLALCRRYARERGLERNAPELRGEAVAKLCEEVNEQMLTLLGLESGALGAARALSARTEAEAAEPLIAYFRAVGASVLEKDRIDSLAVCSNVDVAEAR